MKLMDFINRDAIVADLTARDRDDAIAEMVDAVIAAGGAPAELRDDLIAAVLERESKGSTGFGKGVAVPHVRHDKIEAMTAAIGVSRAGVDFNALDKQPVYTVVLLLSPKEKKDEHLQAMEGIFANLQKDQFRRFLRQAESRDDVIAVLEDADAQRLTA